MKTKCTVTITVLLLLVTLLKGQDSSNTKTSWPAKEKKKFYKTELFKATIVPAVLIAWGLSTIHGHGLYSSYDVYHDIQNLHFKGTHLDNYMQYSPYAELIGLNLVNIRCKNDFVNMALLIAKSELVMNAALWTLKFTTHEVRPDSINPGRTESFPSGHTANAFLAASLVHKEFKHKSIWYGVGAYALATTVGMLRMLNNRHWESDVFVGAGLGILSVHLVYHTHKYRWGKNCNVQLSPSYNKGSIGFCLIKKF